MVLDSNSDSVLLLLWVASWKTTPGGRNYWELKPQIKPYRNRVTNERLSWYKLYSLATTITIPQEEICDDNELQDQQPTGIISRVFRTRQPEISPDISFYSVHEHPHRDFALSCGIRASFCLPMFPSVDDYGYNYYPESVQELVSTSDKEIESARRHLNTEYIKRLYLLGHLLSPRMNSLGLGEMDHVLTEVCEKFTLPLAQCWFPDGRRNGDFRVMYQSSNRGFHNNKLLFNFKDACSQLTWILSDSLVGKTYSSHKSLYCRDITKMSITKYPFAHYARNYGSIACFTIFLSSSFPQHSECVLEFLLPCQEMDVHYPHTLLNSIFAIMKEHLHYYRADSGEKSTQMLSVQVVNSSMHNECESFQIGQPECYHPCYKGLKDEVDMSQEVIRNVLLFKDGIEEGVSAQSNNIFEQFAKSEMPKRTPYFVDEILSEFEKESPMKCIEPQSLACLHKRSREINKAEEMDHSALEMTLQDAIKHKQQSAPAERVKEVAEESPVVDIGYAFTTVSQPSSLQTIKSLPEQAVKEERMVLDTSAQKLLLLENVHHKQNKAITVGVNKDDATTDFVSRTCIEDTFQREKQSKKHISYESISEHFGGPLVDAAKTFGVSRSTFKRICRDLGIKRWQHGKRKTEHNISSNLRRRITDEEPSRRNVSCSEIPPVQDRGVVDNTCQDLNKMTAKATYNDTTIRFELPGLAGFAELQENVIERLHLERNGFSIKYQDDEGDLVLIACDKDVRECMEITRSLKKTTIKLLLNPPINHTAP